MDLNDLLIFVAEQHPGMRVDLFSYQNTGGWRADVAMTFGLGNTPEMAVHDLCRQLGHSQREMERWKEARD